MAIVDSDVKNRLLFRPQGTKQCYRFLLYLQTWCI